MHDSFLTVSTNNKVEIAALLELASATYCKDNARTEENLGFGLSMALAGQFVIDQLDSSLSDLAVPGVQYGERYTKRVIIEIGRGQIYPVTSM